MTSPDTARPPPPQGAGPMGEAPPISSPLLARALEIARAAHAGQVDKAGRPYIEHVLRVVDAVEGEDAKVVAALHDVLEDCLEWTGTEIYDRGIPYDRVVEVHMLTRRKAESYQNYIVRCGRDPLTRSVKLADLRDNLDPVRLALLSERDRERLSRKYAAALAQLES